MIRRVGNDDKAVSEAGQFRGLLWDLANLLEPGERLLVGQGDAWMGRAGATWAHYFAAPRPGERVDDEGSLAGSQVNISLGSIGMHPMVEVGEPYTRATDKERTGLRKATAFGILKDARIIVARKRAQRAAAAQLSAAVTKAKADAEEATGWPMFESVYGRNERADDVEHLSKLGVRSLVPHYTTDAQLRVRAKLEVELPPAQLVALLDLLNDARAAEFARLAKLPKPLPEIVSK